MACTAFSYLYLFVQVQLPNDLKPRIWHVCECTYSTKSEEHLVLVFGGAVDNMFDRLDSEVTVVGDTVLLKFGMYNQLSNSFF